MRLWSLGSGSRGNALLLESGEARVLVDAGFPPRTLAQRLRAVGVEPEAIAACVVTHEHTDHVRGAAAAARRWGWTLHASAGTADAYPELTTAPVARFTAGDTLELPGFSLQTLASSHDAAAPVVLVATARASGARAGIAYDLGTVLAGVEAAFVDLDLLVLESNHDEAMLRAGPYPPVVRARIASRTGHLSNRVAAAFAERCVRRETSHVVLAHLSEKCNTRAVALEGMGAALRRTRFRGALHAAAQDTPMGPFAVRGASRRSTQLSLAL
ncbi:MAG TPA: MBL fold metallo-hydrolase [Gemmatimonadaceae bacterium]|nr:MBL fold metallo-hydrolase [Gemmatimonadaceae bacterium]